jgi:hypothetical protein
MRAAGALILQGWADGMDAARRQTVLQLRRGNGGKIKKVKAAGLLRSDN